MNEILWVFSNIFLIGNNAIKSEIIKRNYHKLYFKIFENENIPKKLQINILSQLYEFLKFSEKVNNKINIIKLEMDQEGISEKIDNILLSTNPEIYNIQISIGIEIFNG